jgi:FAD/FMN-containing dehydrogenase
MVPLRPGQYRPTPADARESHDFLADAPRTPDPCTLAGVRDDAGRFVNWSGTVTTTPTWRSPRDEDEVLQIVREARASGRRVRPVGGGHSWSRIAAPEDLALSLDRLAGVIAIEDGVARVRGGTRLADLCRALAHRGLALPINGSILAQSIAGAIATGTHGSSLRHGNLASLVVGMRLVAGTGEVVALREGDERLDGARVHLGALGVITEVAVRVVPAFHVAETIEHVPIGDAIGHLDAIAASAEYVKLWWMPHTRDAQVFRYTRTDEPASRGLARARWLDDRVIQARLFPRVIAAQRRRPHWIPAINRALATIYVGRARRVGPPTLVLTTQMPVRHRETEAAVPMPRGADALDRVVSAIAREGVRVNFPLEVRFVRGDRGWMSPACGGDTCQIGCYAAEVDVDRTFAAFWRALAPLGARPHWGKELDHDAAALRPLYPAWARFLALRDALDPARVLDSRFHRRVLGS